MSATRFLCQLLTLIIFGISIAGATDIKIKTGKTFRGTIVTETEHYLVIETEGTRINIAKAMVTEIDGAPFSANNRKPVPQAHQHLNNYVRSARESAPQNPPSRSPLGSGASHQYILGKLTRIKLRNGSEFRGRILTIGENHLVLEVGSSRMNIAKNMVTKVDGRKVRPVTPSQETGGNPLGRMASETTKRFSPKRSRPESDSASILSEGTRQSTTKSKADKRVSQPADENRNKGESPSNVDAPAPATQRVSGFSKKDRSAENRPAPTGRPQKPISKVSGSAAEIATSRMSDHPEHVEKSRPLSRTKSNLEKPAPEPPAERSVDTVEKRKQTPWRSSRSDSSRLAMGVAPESAEPPRTAPPRSAPSSSTSRSRITITDVSEDNEESAQSNPTIKPGEMERLIDKLRSRLPENRMRAVLRLRKLGPAASPAVKHLVQLLADTSAFEPLSRSGTTDFSFSSRTSISEQAAHTLAAIGDYAAEPLMDAIHDERWVVRAQAIFVLGEFGYHGAARDLVSALSDTSLVVRNVAVEALVSIGDPKAVFGVLRGKRNDAKQYAIEVLARLKDPSAVQPLTRALRDRDSYVREKAAYALGEIRDRKAAPDLVKALDDNISFVRHNAVEALAKLGDPSVIPYLRAVLKDPSEYVRTEALQAVKDLTAQAYGRHATNTKTLVADLRHDNTEVREKAANALWLLTGKDFGQNPEKWEEWLEKTGGILAPPASERQN